MWHTGVCDGMTVNTDTLRNTINEAHMLTPQEDKARISNCDACPLSTPAYRRFQAPRYGLGCRITPDLMIIRNQPPRSPDRCLHGAYMVHYPAAFDERREYVDHLVSTLMHQVLGLPSSRVFATSGVKCPLHHDVAPPRSLTQKCGATHLAREVWSTKPRIILCLGQVASEALGSQMGHPKVGDKHYKVWQIEGANHSTLTACRTYGNVIEAPSPEWAVERFDSIDEWCATIKEAYDYLVERCYWSGL